MCTQSFVVPLNSPEFTEVSDHASGLTPVARGEGSQHAPTKSFSLMPEFRTHEALEAGFREGVEVLILEGTEDGVSQISQALEGRTGLDAIHLDLSRVCWEFTTRICRVVIGKHDTVCGCSLANRLIIDGKW